MRLNKFLAQAGVASRRKADELISAGQVTINGRVVTELGTKVDPTKDKVIVGGKTLELENVAVTYLLNKPKGVVTTASDPDGKPTVLDIVPKTPRVFPCGRLDENTTGLVVLTNDGDLCYQLTHPKFEHQKEYHVLGDSSDPKRSWQKLQQPIKLDDGPVQIDELKLNQITGKKIDFLITIHDGRHRIVRRISAEVGIEVQSLTRLRIGKYELGDLELGKFKVVN